MGENVFIRMIDMPYSIRGCTSPNPDGTFNIYINARLSKDGRKKALDHELRHIKINHFYSYESIETIEDGANGK